MSCIAVDAGFLLEQYEALRREALAVSPESRRGHGLVLFLTRGMVAWIGALSALSRCRRPRPEDTSALYAGVRPELTTVLANMVLGYLEREER